MLLCLISVFKHENLFRKILVIFKFKDTHREKAPSNKTPALSESTNISMWVVHTSNQQEVLKLKQNSVLCDRTFLLTILFVFTLASDMAVLYGNDAFSVLKISWKYTVSVEFGTKITTFYAVLVLVFIIAMPLIHT